MLAAITWQLIFRNSALRSEKAMISVGHTNVKSWLAEILESVFALHRVTLKPARLGVEQKHSPLLRAQSLAHAHGLDFAVDDGCSVAASVCRASRAIHVAGRACPRVVRCRFANLRSARGIDDLHRRFSLQTRTLP